MDAQGVLSTLFFNQPPSHSPEGLARVLGMVHLYRTSGIHFLAFFSFLEWALSHAFRAFGLRVKNSRFLTLTLCFISIFWIWHLQAFRPSLLRPIATFLIRAFFKERGGLVRVGIPLIFTWLTEWVSIGNPYFAFGALHYYFAVAGGLFAWQGVRHRSLLIQHACLALGSWFPLAAFDLYHDHLVSYLTPFYSMVTLPVITLFLYPLTLSSLLFQADIPEWIVKIWSAFLTLLWKIPESGLSMASVSTVSVYVGFALAFLVCTCPLKGGKVNSRITFLLFFFLAFLRLCFSYLPPTHPVTQLDVGQGDSALFQKIDRNEMIDVGGYKALKTEDWIRKLSRFQVVSLDSLLLSHLDEDHVGALRHLLALLPIGCIETNAAHWSSDKGQRLQIIAHEYAPDTRLVSAHCMRMVEPHWFLSRAKGAKGNELMSGVVYEINAQSAYLALGDGDQEQELQYLRYFEHQIATHPKRILKISHHGSKYSSGESFLNQVQAQEYWISAGKHNFYHHPHPLTLLRLSHERGTVHRTDVEGDLTSFVE